MEPNYQEEPIDLSLRKSIDSDESINSEDSSELDEFNHMDNEAVIKGFKEAATERLAQNIRRISSSPEGPSASYVVRSYRDLQYYRENFREHHGRWQHLTYVYDILPYLLPVWWFDTVILSDDYYQELINTVMFLAKEIGTHFMVDIIVKKLLKVNNYNASGDQANLVKKQCHKIAMEMIAKIILTTDFQPVNASPFLENALSHIICRYKRLGIQDPVMEESINTIVNELCILVESSDSDAPDLESMELGISIFDDSEESL
ncbi:uncharacterized protein LOC103573551 [Microplitis demolitor]|uniref:uncharacterized protein LOC103573551 n=1 Tax=Microplitis demolitor TaxID=69319 RepID=UPI0006D4F083|nr:uncharacterized protein LOC103573551 [Microplitis demolitor]